MNAREDAQALRLLQRIWAWAVAAVPVLCAIAGAIWYAAHHLAAFAQTQEQANSTKSALVAHEADDDAERRKVVELLHRLDSRLVRIEERMGIDPKHTESKP